VAVLEVRSADDDNQQTIIHFPMAIQIVHHHGGTDFIVHKGIISALKIVEFISDRMSHVTLKDSWCDIIS
jgi:hypothetical protein